MAPAPAEQAALSRPWLRYAAVLLLILSLNLAGGWLVAQVDFTLTPKNSDMVYNMLLLIAALYVVVIAVPFVPGIELGLALLLVLGTPGIPFVYTCNLLALALAFLIGRLIPLRRIGQFFGWLRLKRASDLIETMAGYEPRDRLTRATERLPAGWAQRLLRHRHLAIGVVLNLPGNALIGGAGGIAMISGMSQIFRFPAFLLTMAIATTPVPIVLLLMD